MKILLVEDDDLVADSLTRALEGSDYVVEWSNSAMQAELLVSTESYDLVILDLNLPEMDGMEFLKHIRKKHIGVPVIILTARDSYDDRIIGLDCGANDYVTKPFHLGELEARIRAVLRRGVNNSPEVMIGNLTFDTVNRVLRCKGEIVELSKRESAVLEVLLLNLGSVVSKQKMVSLLGDWETPATYNAVDIIIHRLRKKLEPHGLKLQTIRGLGFIAQP